MVVSGREAHELSDWGPPRDSTGPEVESVEHQLRMNPEVADALLGALYTWTQSRIALKNTFWMTDDAMAMVAGGPGESKGWLHVCWLRVCAYGGVSRQT